MATYMIQNVDRTITVKDYKHLADNQLLVHGMFYTIQGEGSYAGVPAFFVRLAGCNFGAKDHGTCLWCDTAFHYDNGKAMTFDEIYVEYAKATPGVGTLMVITGGEPSLQTNLVELIRFMSERDIPTQIESNGTRVPLLIECLVASSGQCTVVISPKASHKGYGDLRPSITALDQASEGFDYYFKFVVTADEDDKHHTVPDEVLEYAELNPGSLYISPMAVYKKPYVGEVSSAWDHELIDAERTSKNYAYAAKYVMEHPGLVLSIQQHLFCNLA